MNPAAVARSRHGWMRMPSTAVMSPPMRNEIHLGARCAKSFAGPTTLAAMSLSPGRCTASIAAVRRNGFVNVLSSSIGSQIFLPKMTTVADVTATPMNDQRAIVSGNPIVLINDLTRCDRRGA